MAKGKFESCILQNLEAIESMVKKGADDAEIARKVGISPRTFCVYVANGRRAEADENKGKELSDKEKDFLRFYQAYMRARVVPDETVEAALFNSCQDHFVVRNIRIRKVYDDNGNVIEEHREEEVLIPASVPAQQFYLANKKRRDWEYKPDPSKEDGKQEQAAIVLVPKEKLEKPQDD